MASCQSAGGGACTISGADDEGRPFATMTTDDITGGGGARYDLDGADSSGFTTSPGAAVANVEVNESYLPLRYLVRRELADSGGTGLHRGGVGVVQLIAPYHIHQPIQVLSFGQGLQHPCAIGVAGGEPGGQSGFAIMAVERGQGLLDVVGSAAPAEPAGPPGKAGGARRADGTEVPLPTAGMSMSPGEAQLLVSQGGGGFADPLEREPAAVAADVAEGLVSMAAADRDYGVVFRNGPGNGRSSGPGDSRSSGPGVPIPDPEATAARRHALRVERLGGREPLPALPPSSVPEGRQAGQRTRPFSHALVLVQEGGDEGPSPAGGAHLACRRCGTTICQATDDVYEHAVVRAVPAAARAPFALTYPGSEQFVVWHCYCPGCARQFDVQIGRRHEGVLRAAEPLLGPPPPDG